MAFAGSLSHNCEEKSRMLEGAQTKITRLERLDWPRSFEDTRWTSPRKPHPYHPINTV